MVNFSMSFMIALIVIVKETASITPAHPEYPTGLGNIQCRFASIRLGLCVFVRIGTEHCGTIVSRYSVRCRRRDGKYRRTSTDERVQTNTQPRLNQLPFPENPCVFLKGKHAASR